MYTCLEFKKQDRVEREEIFLTFCKTWVLFAHFTMNEKKNKNYLYLLEKIIIALK